MKNRPAILVYAEILRQLSGGPRGKTRLARVCNIPLDRFELYIAPLSSRGMVRREISEGHEIFHITVEGMTLLNDIESVLRRISP